MHIVAISGKAGHGKDTVAQLLADELRQRNRRVLITHYADLLKYICRTFFAWNGEKDEDGRSLLQFVGTDVIRAEQPDYWVDFIAEILSMFDDCWDFVVIPDTRFPNEIDKLRAEGFDVTHLRVIRPGFDAGLTEKQKNHPSETALDQEIPDLTVMNTGDLEQLAQSADVIAADLNRNF